MADFTLSGISSTAISAVERSATRRSYKPAKISCVAWDPEGIYRGPPQTCHLARREFKKRLEKDDELRQSLEQQVREEKQRRLALRMELIEYFLDTEAQDFEYEIGRLRPRLNQEFFSQLQFELGKLRFAVSKTQDMEDRTIELEALQKALQEGIESYDKMQAELIKAKESLTKILTSKDIKATLLEMVETSELNRSLLPLLDENIANANQIDQVRAVVCGNRSLLASGLKGKFDDTVVGHGSLYNYITASKSNLLF